jgi:hypothetical protein
MGRITTRVTRQALRQTLHRTIHSRRAVQARHQTTSASLVAIRPHRTRRASQQSSLVAIGAKSTRGAHGRIPRIVERSQTTGKTTLTPNHGRIRARGTRQTARAPRRTIEPQRTQLTCIHTISPRHGIRSSRRTRDAHAATRVRPRRTGAAIQKGCRSRLVRRPPERTLHALVRKPRRVPVRAARTRKTRSRLGRRPRHIAKGPLRTMCALRLRISAVRPARTHETQGPVRHAMKPRRTVAACRHRRLPNLIRKSPVRTQEARARTRPARVGVVGARRTIGARRLTRCITVRPRDTVHTRQR